MKRECATCGHAPPFFASSGNPCHRPRLTDTAEGECRADPLVVATPRCNGVGGGSHAQGADINVMPESRRLGVVFLRPPFFLIFAARFPPSLPCSPTLPSPMPIPGPLVPTPYFHPRVDADSRVF